MKKLKPSLQISIISFLLLLVGALNIQAANVTKKDTITMNGGAADWSAAPAATDVGEFGATPSSTSLVNMTLGGNLTLSGLKFDATMQGPLTISAANTLTLDDSLFASAAGITQVSGSPSVTLGNALTLKGRQAWTTASGTSLTISGTLTTAGAWVDFSNYGGSLNGVANVNGILGPWATYSSGTTLKYATVSAGFPGGYVGGTAAATAANVTDTTGTVNYDVAAVGALGAGASVNTIRYTGAAGTISGNFTANGLMNAGSGLLTVSGNPTIGANKELVLAPNANGMTFSGVIANNAGGASALTINADPAATVTLTGANTFTGNITINSGTLAANKSAATGGTGGALGNANSTSRSVTINSGATLDFLIGNVMGQLGTTTKNANPTPVIINGGTMLGDKTSELIGALTLNGGTVQCRVLDTGLNFKLSGSGKTYENGYLAFQLGGDVTVTGTSASTISGNGQDFTHAQDGLSLHAGTTTFNVADVTGDANPDLTISAAIDDVNADYGAGFPQLGTLVKAGAGTMVLSGMNFYDGGTTVSAGTIVAGTTDGQTIPVAGTGTGVAGPFANAAGAFGKPGTTLTLGDANTASASPTVLIGGAYTVGHPITVANQGSGGTFAIGGSTDNNATFSGAITLNKNLSVSQVTTTSGHTLTLSGGITAGSGTPTVTFAGPGSITATTAALANGSGTLSVNIPSGGDLYLTFTPTYTGLTTVNGTLDVSGLSGGNWTLGSQLLIGSGTINGSVTTASATSIYPATDGTVGTLTITNNLNISGGAVYFDLSTSHSSGNDQIAVGGSLTVNGGVIHIKALSGATPLDGSDYVLIAGTSTATLTALPTISWDGTAPGNSTSYNLAVVGNNLVLQHSSSISPSVSATVTPTSVVRNQTVTVNATVTVGSPGTINPSTGVTVNLIAIGGSSTQVMTDSGDHIHYSYTQAVGAGISVSSVANDKSITVTVIDSLSLSGASSPTLTVNAATEIWNGGGSGNWTDNADWTSYAPGYAGDTLDFAGTVGLTSTMNHDYSITSLSFDSGASGFTIGTSSSTLTITAGGVTNNSSSAQILNVPVVLTTAAQTLNAAAGDLTLGSTVNNSGNLLTVTDGGHNTTISGAISGAGGLTKSGTGTNTLSGGNTYTGPTTISAGTLDYNSSANQILSGVISGAGAFIKDGTGILSNTAASTLSGNITVNNGTLVDSYGLSSPNITASGLGNPQTSGRTVTINNGGTVAFNGGSSGNAGNFLGNSASTTVALGFIINQGGTLQLNNGNTPVGAITLNGGTMSATTSSGGSAIRYGTYYLNGDVTVGGSSHSTIISTSTSSTGNNINLTINAAGTRTFTVAPTGDSPDLIVSSPLGDAANLTTGGSDNLIKAGAGTMQLNSVNLYSGTTTVSAGTLEAGVNAPSGSAGAFGNATSAITLGDAATTSGNTSPSLMIGGAFTVGRAVTVASQGTSGTYSIGGSTDNNATFGGAITVNEPLTISQVANTGGNGLIISGGITAGSGTPTVTFAGPGNVNVTTVGIANGSGTVAVSITGGTVTNSAANTYTGNTVISAGTLALSGSGSLASPLISVGGGATFDASTLSSTFTLGSQTLTNSSTGTASINGSLTAGSGTVSLAYVSGTPSLTVPGGTFTVSSGTTFKVSTATTLGQGSYKLISKSGSGTVAAGTLPAVTVGGAGVAAGALTSLSVSGGELYLNVSSPLTANPNTYTRNGSVTWMLKVANLMTNVTELDVTTTNLTSVGTSTNGVTLDITSIPGYVLYNNPNLVDDKFSYTVTDGNGWTDTATITLTAGTVPSVGGQANNINYSGGTATLTFAGIPGYKYNVQLNTVDVSNPLDWSTVFTTNAPMGGVFQYVDPTPPTPNAYYRLMWNGN